jgi:mRNA interferase RelE/StbE
MTLADRQTYRLNFTPGADRQFRKLPKQVQARLSPHLDALTQNPRPPGVEKLTGEEGYRLCVRDYRVLYEIHDKIPLVRIVKIGHRRDVYRKR